MDPAAARDRLRDEIRFMSSGEQSAILNSFDKDVQKNPSRNPDDIASKKIREVRELLDD